MKKYLFLSCLLFILTPLAVAQNVNRNTVMPGFFVPNNALTTTSSPENLQANPMAQYRGKQLKDVYNLQTEEREQQTMQPQQYSTQSNARQNTEQTIAGPMPQSVSANDDSNNQKSYVRGSFQVENEPFEEETNNFEPVLYSEDFNNKTTSSSYSDIKSDADKIREALKHMSVEEYMQQLANGGANESSAVYDKIFNEYEQDLARISQHQPVTNERLDKMLSDYHDEDRHL